MNKKTRILVVKKLINIYTHLEFKIDETIWISVIKLLRSLDSTITELSSTNSKSLCENIGQTTQITMYDITKKASILFGFKDVLESELGITDVNPVRALNIVQAVIIDCAATEELLKHSNVPKPVRLDECSRVLARKLNGYTCNVFELSVCLNELSELSEIIIESILSSCDEEKFHVAEISHNIQYNTSLDIKISLSALADVLQKVNGRMKPSCGGSLHE